MKQMIEIDVPAGYVAIFNAESHNIEFVKEDNRPKSWEEYQKLGDNYKYKDYCDWSKGFEAFRQLIFLRNAWWKASDWKPDWCSSEEFYCIVCNRESIRIRVYSHDSRVLAFKDHETASEFLECFHDLIEEAKMFI